MTVNIFDASLSGLLSEEDIKAQQVLVESFDISVAHVRELIESDKKIIGHGPVSQGKDSTVVELILLEAYRQSLAEGKIEPSRPLILSTVDTLNEAIPMKMYTRYCKKRVEDYAASVGINLYYDIVTPGVNDEYFVKFTGGQKLVPNASRRGDCSIILKVDPSERYVKTQLNRFRQTLGMAQYADATVISFVGSRTDEGVRRSSNMSKQGLRDKGAKELFAEMESSSIDKKTTILKFAPIKNWATDDVFDLLRLAGKRPVTRMIDGTKEPVPAFLDNFGLLLEIYGNGSNDVCEVAIGATKQGSGCNGKARYGCWNCTMVANTDNSSTALTKYPRWMELGAEDALRIRDYLFRLSCDMGARAFHARAYDPTGFNRVALQPNVLKPKHLEKMIRYASQLSVDSIEKAKAFKALVDAGREMEHPGYADIANDMQIPPKARKSFLEMYKECAQEPIFTSFSEKHALLLSFRWSIDGIGAAPYRPLALWKQALKGEGRIPYPMLNSEFEERFGKIKMIDPANPLPDALMAPIYKVEDAKDFANKKPSLYDLWERPIDKTDIYDEAQNCTTTRIADNSSDLSVKINFDYSVKFNEKGMNGVTVALNDFTYSGAKFMGRKPKPRLFELLKLQGIDDNIVERFNNQVESLIERAWIDHPNADDKESRYESVKLGADLLFSKESVFKAKVPFVKEIALATGYQESQRKPNKKLNFTKRVTKVKNGKLSKHNTRLSFYFPDSNSSLHNSYACNANIWVPDFSSHSGKLVNTSEVACHEEDFLAVTENIQIDESGYRRWVADGGVDKLIELHDKYLRELITKRHVRGYTRRDVRKYGGTHVAEDLLSLGPITIAPNYWRQLQKILKRTQVFDALGLFKYQSYTYAEMAQLKNIVTMEEHRKDKAKIMSHIRNDRNAQRREVRQALALYKKGSYGREVLKQLDSNLGVWTEACLDSMNTIESYWAVLSNVLFDTHEIGISRRVSLAQLWLVSQTEMITSTEKLLKHLLSTRQFSALKDDKLAMERALELIGQHTAPLLNQCKEKKNRWLPVFNKLDGKNELSGDNAKEYRAAFKDIITTTLPDFCLVNDMFKFWNPNLENAKKHVRHLEFTLRVNLNELSLIDCMLMEFQNSSIKSSKEKQFSLI